MEQKCTIQKKIAVSFNGGLLRFNGAEQRQKKESRVDRVLLPAATGAQMSSRLIRMSFNLRIYCDDGDNTQRWTTRMKYRICTAAQREQTRHTHDTHTKAVTQRKRKTSGRNQINRPENVRRCSFLSFFLFIQAVIF